MSVASAWPDHLLSLPEWDALSEHESWLVELVEGVLLVVPKPAPMHQRMMMRLSSELDRQLPAEFTALAEVEVLIAAGALVTVRAPDVVVLANDRAEENPARLLAKDVLVAIEIVSPGSGRTDRVTKMAEYAEAGIPHYWIIELGPPAHMATYSQAKTGEPYLPVVAGAGTIELAAPARLHLDLDSFTRR